VSPRSVTDSRPFDAPPEAVWQVISDPTLYAAVAPNLSRVEILEGHGQGMVRECADTHGRTWTEVCTAWEPERRYAVEVDVEGSPVHRHLFHAFAGEWRMEPSDEGVLVTLTFEYEPRYGPFGRLIDRFVEREAARLTPPIFDGWAREIESRRTVLPPEC
jgi:uncharacterized protein YndB with AHSA1/START domain